MHDITLDNTPAYMVRARGVACLELIVFADVDKFRALVDKGSCADDVSLLYPTFCVFYYRQKLL